MHAQTSVLIFVLDMFARLKTSHSEKMIFIFSALFVIKGRLTLYDSDVTCLNKFCPSFPVVKHRHLVMEIVMRTNRG